MQPWATMVAITVVYEDGHTRVAKVYPSEDALDEVCDVSHGDLHEVLDGCAGAYWSIVKKGKRSHRGYGRGDHYPVAVVVSMVEGALFGGHAPDPRDPLSSDFEVVGHSGRASTFRVFDVSGYVFMEELSRLLEGLHEWRLYEHRPYRGDGLETLGVA